MTRLKIHDKSKENLKPLDAMKLTGSGFEKQSDV